MATSQQSLFKCCICLDDFTEPVSTPCGHNFCLVCINNYWDSSNAIQCPLCKQTFSKRPLLRVNVLLRDLIGQKQTKSSPEEPKQAPDIVCDLCAGEERKVKAAKSCLLCEESFCSEHVKPHQNDEKLKSHELLDPVSRLKDRLCKQHKTPLELVCQSDLTCVCVLCIKSNHKDHQCVPLKNRLEKKKAKVDQELSELQQKIKDRKKMLKAVDQSKEINEENSKRDIADILTIFNHFKEAVKENESRLLTVITALCRKNERRSETMKENLHEEISELEDRKDELDHLSQIKDDLRLLQRLHSLSEPPTTKDWSEISVYSDSAVGTVRSGVGKFVLEFHNRMQNETEKMVAKEIKRIKQYAVDVTLDSNTANEQLIVSSDGKQVKNEGSPQKVPDNPERFDILLGVLGKEGYSSGAFYFEVQVEGMTSWDIGVALETVDRKGLYQIGLNHGYVVLMLRDGKTLKACDQNHVELSAPKTIKKIGVFVDHEEGEVCFYDVGIKAHIYSFTGCKFPRKKLLPYLNTCMHVDGSNFPMVITPVK
ncbi:E3 ubiquitin-protein ligase TRIM39-like [Acanthochromis polyacanthus]|uniref:E3 ubiquitin-protein ligase TRIM39-like n=1 Tax=Acanthochromis polyacanthus TaxID=80966 RepID=A0A3Q1FDV5_9TELE|nr:E3 ubiquitin-protein ligase TRIM39-like [Acanthochromis polyacanthus]